MNSLTTQQTADIAEYAAQHGWSFTLAFEMYGYIGHAAIQYYINQ